MTACTVFSDDGCNLVVEGDFLPKDVVRENEKERYDEVSAHLIKHPMALVFAIPMGLPSRKSRMAFSR